MSAVSSRSPPTVVAFIIPRSFSLLNQRVPKPSGDWGQYLRRHLSRRGKSLAKGLCRSVGAAVRATENAGGGGQALTCWGVVLCRSLTPNFMLVLIISIKSRAY